MAPDAREPRLLHVLTDARGRDFAALDDALGQAGGALVRRACVAVRGLSPVGVETARLLLASDVGEIVLLDEPRDAAVKPSDIGATSVLTEEHLGKPRSIAVVEALNSKRFCPAHRESPVVRAAGPKDALWTGQGETVVRDDERAKMSPRGTPDVLVSAWHLDTPWMADDSPSDDPVASVVLKHGGTHVIAAAPGLFAFVRAARRTREQNETPAAADASDSDASASSDSDEPDELFLRDPDVNSVQNLQIPERRFRDARLARAPVSLVESVVPADGDDDDGATNDEETGKTAKLFFVTVCDANAHGLREGDGVAFINPLEDDRANCIGAGTVARGGERLRSVVGVVTSVAGRHAFAVSIEKETLDGSDASRLAGTYVRQRRRRDAKLDGSRPASSNATEENIIRFRGIGWKRKRDAAMSSESNLSNDEQEKVFAERFKVSKENDRRKPFVDPRDVFGVSSHVFARDAATVPPAVAAARVATAFLEMSLGNERALDVVKDDEKRKKTITDDSVERAIKALRRGARVAFPPCVGVAAAVASHETLKTLARVQIPLVSNASDRGGWFAHDSLELDPAFSKRRDDADDDARCHGAASAATVEDLIGADVLREAAARETVVVGAAAFGRAFDETLKQVSVIRLEAPIRSYPSIDAVPASYLDSRVDVLILAGAEGFESRRAADAASTQRRFSLIDVGVENHLYSAYVAAVDRTAPWSCSGARDPSTPSFPSCVVGNFPHAFPHCAQWARERFAKEFVELPERVREWADAWAAFAARGEKSGRPDREAFFREHPSGVSMKASSNADALLLALDAVPTFSALKSGYSVGDEASDGFRRACVTWGLKSFERLFKREPNDLLHSNPLDSRTKSGSLFWSGTKRLPRALNFDVTDPRRATFVVAAAMLFAALFHRKDDVVNSPASANAGAFLETLLEMAREEKKQAAENGSDTELLAVTRKCETPEGTDERRLTEDADASRLIRLAEATLDAFEDGPGFRLTPSTPFDGHRRDPTRAAFVAAAAACRAVVFRVPVPRERELAAATTGACPGTPAPAAFAAALAAVETYKLASWTAAKSSSQVFDSDSAETNLSDLRLNERPPSDSADKDTSNATFRCSYGSLGGHAHVSASPAVLETKTAKTSTRDLRFTAWDAFFFDARDERQTLNSFLDTFRSQVGLEPSTVARGAALLFADFMNLNKPELVTRMNTPLKTLFEDAIVDKKYDEDQASQTTRVLLSVTACDENDDDVDVPEVWVRIR